MPQALIECIANYSEARRPAVVEAIIASITGVAGVRLLDRHSDLDHNRTVLTFVGEPASVEEAAFRSIAKAGALINLDEHTGEHPRIGATDVVPFVPLAGVSMADCVAMARRLGARVGDELSIPVYLYEEAATRPERQNLENLRRGQYEALKVEMGVKPERDPDFGPHRVGTAGATVIGARQPLVAFNVYLTTGDLSIAKKIAKTVRHSSGGFRYVKALGMLVEGLAQVSMNLTNFHGTPLALVVEAIRREAARFGVAVHHTELVGLIPQEALVDAAVWYMQLDQFEQTQILENRLYAPETPTGPPATNAQSETFLEALASGAPTPGGGAAAAYSAAMAAALVAMVARLTLGKKKYAEVALEMQSIVDQADRLRENLTTTVHRDSAAFQAWMAALRLPKESSEQVATRERAIQQAALTAAQVPLEVARQSVEILALSAKTAAFGNLNAISDSASGAALARAALNSAGWNVRINCQSLPEQPACAEMQQELHLLEARADELETQVRQQMQVRGQFTP